MRPDLTHLQQTFANALLDLNCIEPALALFKGDPKQNRERFAYYRGNITGIWQQTCAGAYPVLQQLVGKKFFDALTRAYGLAHASQSGNLTDFGASLSSYISTLENCKDAPYLADLAALEWHVHRTYYLEQSTPITLAQLAPFPLEQLPELHLQLQTNCALFQSPWAVADIWQAHQDVDAGVENAMLKEIVKPELVKPNYCLIWRPYGLTRWKVQVSRISAASYAALQTLTEGKTLGAALESALEKNPEFAIQTELADWFDKQLFNRIVSTNSP